MNTNDLNTALYEKMAAEQDKFRDWLKSQSRYLFCSAAIFSLRAVFKSLVFMLSHLLVLFRFLFGASGRHRAF